MHSTPLAAVAATCVALATLPQALADGSVVATDVAPADLPPSDPVAAGSSPSRRNLIIMLSVLCPAVLLLAAGLYFVFFRMADRLSASLRAGVGSAHTSKAGTAAVQRAVKDWHSYLAAPATPTSSRNLVLRPLHTQHHLLVPLGGGGPDAAANLQATQARVGAPGAIRAFGVFNEAKAYALGEDKRPLELPRNSRERGWKNVELYLEVRPQRASRLPVPEDMLPLEDDVEAGSVEGGEGAAAEATFEVWEVTGTWRSGTTTWKLTGLFTPATGRLVLKEAVRNSSFLFAGELLQVPANSLAAMDAHKLAAAGSKDVEGRPSNASSAVDGIADAFRNSESGPRPPPEAAVAEKNSLLADGGCGIVCLVRGTFVANTHVVGAVVAAGSLGTVGGSSDAAEVDPTASMRSASMAAAKAPGGVHVIRDSFCDSMARALSWEAVHEDCL